MNKKGFTLIEISIAVVLLVMLAVLVIPGLVKNDNKTKKTRAHYVLFRKDTPFKPKVVRNKRTYTRKIKHSHKMDHNDRQYSEE